MIRAMTYRVADLRRFDRELFVDGRARTPRYLEVQPTCWMCPAQDVAVTREHIFGKWVRKYLPAADLVFEPHRAGPLGLDFSDARGPMPLGALQVGRVCASCNNGWMSRLEDHAERVLFGADRSLDVDGALRLAHWAVKTAVIINVSQPSALTWPQQDRHRVRTGPFERTAVSLWRAPRADANWAQGGPVIGLTRLDPAEQMTLLALAPNVRIWLNDIVLLVVRLPWQMHGYRLRLPGHTIWDGAAAQPVHLDAVEQVEDWRGDLVQLDNEAASAFWAEPSLDDHWRPTRLEYRDLGHRHLTGADPASSARRDMPH